MTQVALPPASVKVETGQLLFEIDRLEERIRSDRDNVNFLVELSSLCLKVDKREKAYGYIQRALDIFSHNQTSGATLTTTYMLCIKLLRVQFLFYMCLIKLLMVSMCAMSPSKYGSTINILKKIVYASISALTEVLCS